MEGGSAMARRPNLTTDTFLAYIFHPKKNAMPTGMRKRNVSSAKGRNARRVRAFNKLTPAQQRVLDTTGNREKYLKGEITLTEAKRELREQAIQRGIAKPLRTLKERAITNILTVAEQRIISEKSSAIRKDTVERNVDRMTVPQRRLAARVSYEELAELGRDNERLEVDTDTGEEWNPFWYK
jgi:hypothetical protein